MADDLFHVEHAHARRTDPDTSHEAAAAATSSLERQRALVAAYARSRGEQGFMDVQLEESHPEESESGLRTRRSELTARNVILDSGRRDRHGGSVRRRIVWVHREFVDNPPALIEVSPAVQREALQAEARALAAQHRSFSRQMRKEGRAMLADALERTAEVLTALSA